MQIEEGKFYRTRDGQKIGPMRVYEVVDNTFDIDDDGDHWGSDGLHGEGIFGHNPDLDLVAVWQDKPSDTAPAQTPHDHLSAAAEKFIGQGNYAAAIEVLKILEREV